MDAIPANLALIDGQGAIIAVNKPWLQFGIDNNWNDVSGGVGANYLDVCRTAAAAGDGVAGMVVDGVGRLLAGETDRFSLEYPCHSPSVQRWFTCLAAPLPLDEGHRGMLLLHIDITARRMAEEQLAEVNQARYDFICALAHEVRSPLQAIIGFAELIEMASADASARVRNHAHHIAKGGRHVVEVVSDVLDLTCAEAGGFELCEVELDLAEVADVAVDTLAGLAATALVTLRRHGPSGVRVLGDVRLLRQALINVVSNAIHVSPPGRTVDLAVGALADGPAVIRVTDHGRGIAPEDIGRITEPFVQLKASGGAGRAGSGLGLPLARRFLHLHQGDLRFTSAPGAGTTVTLELPAARRRTANT